MNQMILTSKVSTTLKKLREVAGSYFLDSGNKVWFANWVGEFILTFPVSEDGSTMGQGEDNLTADSMVDAIVDPSLGGLC